MAWNGVNLRSRARAKTIRRACGSVHFGANGGARSRAANSIWAIPMPDIRWEPDVCRYGMDLSHDLPPQSLAYTGIGPRWWFKIEGGKLYRGIQDA
jgi:hypothetical protein